VRAYVTGGIVGLIGALAIGSPAAALLGTVMLMLAMVGLAGAASPTIRISTRGLPASAVEGEPFQFTARVEVDQPIGRAYLDLGLSGLTVVEASGASKVGPSMVSIPAVSESAVVEVTVSPDNWGRSVVGPLRLQTSSPLGMFDFEHVGDSTGQVVVVPVEMELRRLPSPAQTSLHVGDLISKRRGVGSEFADLRPFQDGDDPRSVNWRVSSRAQTLWVNERHPERNGDVVILVDARVEARTEMHLLIDRSVRLATALLRGYTRHHHRLGLVTLDGRPRWITPGMGELHRRRLIEQLMGLDPGQVVWDFAERAVIRVAKRPATVLALTPLMDHDRAGLIHSLRRSGVDISVINLAVESVLSPPDGEVTTLARRIWVLERERLRDRLIGEGVPIAVWHPEDPADVPLAQLELWRTSWRRRG
jgi:uncharacterized protein (DUF58 family)